MRYLIILFAAVLASCQATDEAGHEHDEAGNHVAESAGAPPVIDATVWTDDTELFVEFPALIAGRSSRFAAHFTVMDGHRPVREGKVTVSLTKGKNGIRNSVDAPSSPGIFSPSLKPKEAGTHRLVFDLETPFYSDRITVGDVTVYASAGEALKASVGKEEEGSIPFLKEQAWKMEFRTAPVIRANVYESIPTSGIWKAAPSDDQVLVATTSGRVRFPGDKLTEGSKVRKGQTLMRLSSEGLTGNNLGSEIRKAKAGFEQAKAEFERKKSLHESRIVSKAEFEKAEQKYRVAKAHYETLNAGYASNGKQIIAPFDGYIKSIAVANGDFVDQGAALTTVARHRSGILEVQVGQTYAMMLENIRDVLYQAKAGVWSSLAQNGGRVLAVSKKVEKDKPLISIYTEVNEPVEMPEGGFTEVELAVGAAVEGPVVPASALLEDYGNYSVIVQLSGERFERRNVIPGRRNGNGIEIKQGLRPGEVVVTKGAYQVKMASMSGQAPAHGHEH
ncbi:MAG: efflux RND transporter periplasmic adaptor subunit [Cytophagales bacterium]|nr:efflux RND transporter periplasmic adaptor subunit [Cytophagales bacterium]